MHHSAPPILLLLAAILYNNDTIYLYKENRGKLGEAPRFDAHKGDKVQLLPDLTVEVAENFPPTPIAHVVVLHEIKMSFEQFNQLRNNGWLIAGYEG
ncbi:MAG: hypothetical protein AAB378_00415 [Patescibacteria group bacterium]